MKYIPTWETLKSHSLEPLQTRFFAMGCAAAVGDRQGTGFSLVPSLIWHILFTLIVAVSGKRCLGWLGLMTFFTVGMYVDCSSGKWPVSCSFLYSSCSGMQLHRHPICKTHADLYSLHICYIYFCSTWQ